MSAESNTERSTVSGPLSILFPVDMTVWSEARKLVADKKVRVEDLALCASQDPAIVIELLKTSNALFFSGGKSPITTCQTAIVRLGSDVVLESLDKIRERVYFEDLELANYFELARGRCRRMAIVARILGESISRNLAEDCAVAALLIGVGEMVAIAHLKVHYIELARENTRTALLYRLAQDYKLDLEKLTLAYLRRQGIPEAILFALDREGRSRLADRALLKPISMAAHEMVEAFDANRWDKLSPGRPLNPKSALRTLSIADSQYLKIYERASEYLFAARLEEESRRTNASGRNLVTQEKEYDEESPTTNSFPDPLNEEISALILDNSNENNTPTVAPVQRKRSSRSKTAPRPSKSITNIVEIDTVLQEDAFSLKSKEQAPQKTPRVDPAKAPQINLPIVNSPKSLCKVEEINSMFSKVNTSEELLSNLLEMLVKDNLFEKAALVVVSRDRKKALVVAARGPNIGNGQRIDLTDIASPLANCFSKIQSFGNRDNENSPWGSKAFALSPIDADHGTPVALYADCGKEAAISFEARRIFRNVVGILNEKLPTIPGGIPVEL